MQFSAVLALGLAAVVSAGDFVTTTTDVVTAYTTVCPSPTTFAYGNQTYTVTSSTTITITNCPCHIKTTTPPVYSTVYVCPPAANTTLTYEAPCPTGTTTIYVPPGVTTTYCYTPSPTPYLPVTPVKPTTPGTVYATATPVKPTTTPSSVVTAGAGKLAPGALVAGALALLAL